MKKTIRSISLLLFAVITILSISSCGSQNSISSEPETNNPIMDNNYTDYQDVLSVCLQAVKEKNQNLLDEVILPAFGRDWNYKRVYCAIDDWYYNNAWDGDPDPVFPDKIEDYKTNSTFYKSYLEVSEVEEMIKEKTDVSINVEEGLELEMDTEEYSMIEFFFIKVSGRWYVFYMDM